MRPLTILAMTVLLAGCANINIPSYIKDNNPYRKNFYAPYERVHEAVITALKSEGWKIEGESDPIVFERAQGINKDGRKNVLIFTEVRSFSYFFGSRYSRINAYVRTASSNAVEVELRYMKISSWPLKSFTRFRSDATANRVFQAIEAQLTPKL